MAAVNRGRDKPTASGGLRPGEDGPSADRQADNHRKAQPVRANSGGGLREALDDFLQLQELVAAQDDGQLLGAQPQMVSRYYDVVTRFYEYAWGTSFHFAPRRSGERLRAAQRRQEAGVAALLELGPAKQVADVGCGVGGPMMSIARVSHAKITGLNLNAMQIQRGRTAVRKAGLEDRCSFLLANFLEVPLDDACFDAAYSFEAICHSPDKRRCLEEMRRLLMPGGQMALTEWCLTERFDSDNPTHCDIRDRIAFANSAPNLLTASEWVAAAESAGFEVLSARDQALECDADWPWYRALQGRDTSFASLARIPSGRWLTAKATALLERLRIAPAGVGEASRLLNVAADALVEAGEAGIFSPCFLVHARKPRGPRATAAPFGSAS